MMDSLADRGFPFLVQDWWRSRGSIRGMGCLKFRRGDEGSVREMLEKIMSGMMVEVVVMVVVTIRRKRR